MFQNLKKKILLPKIFKKKGPNRKMSLSYKVQQNILSYQPNLTPAELNKAANQLNEFTNETRSHAINHLARQVEHTLPAKFLSNPTNFNKFSNPVFLLRFLRCAKYNADKAVKKALKWAKMYDLENTPWPEVTKFLIEADEDPNSKLHKFMKSFNPMYICKSVGKNENTGAWAVIREPPVANYPGPVEEYIALLGAQAVYVVDKILNIESVQIHGFYLLGDSSKSNKNNTAFLLRLDLMKKLINLFTGLPARQKGDISIKSSFLSRASVKMVLPLLPQKMRNRMIYLGNKRSELEEHLDVNNLTVNYYGKLQNSQCLDYFEYRLPSFDGGEKGLRPPPPQVPARSALLKSKDECESTISQDVNSVIFSSNRVQPPVPPPRPNMPPVGNLIEF